MNLTFLAAVGAGVTGHPTAGLVALQAATHGDLTAERPARTPRRGLPWRRRTAAATPAPTTTVVTLGPLPTAAANRPVRENGVVPAPVAASAGAGSR
ncbi:hypothetical protein GXP71_08050 [Cellulomonas sp. H30R-01]|uniref:hypothetical protein n=1 Tax=Cellulomonas sp. H30R-01 TaxID=2704467 RepID=UPI00138C296E|nr:hypothetical protein [Cellulomonas sp. H30R-01]QHT56034.1 hypothetical protein GXP71_08050 [Cellulomonas sp. H30R-01]